MSSTPGGVFDSSLARLHGALERLNEIGARINRLGRDDVGNVNTALRLIAEGAIQVVPGSSAVIYSYDSDHDSFDFESRVSAGDWIAPDSPDLPRAEGLGRRALARRRRVLSYESSELSIHPVKAEQGAQSVAVFPLMVAGQVVGVLYQYLHRSAARQFTQLELLLLDNFVNQAAMAIYQARQLSAMTRSLARKEDELSRLRRANRLISARVGLQETLDTILAMALEVTDAHYGNLRLVDEAGQRLLGVAFAGDQLAALRTEPLPIDEHSVSGWVALHRRPARIDDLREPPWKSIYYPLDSATVMRSELVVPLIGGSGRLEGVINLESPAPGSFSEEDALLLQALATQAVIAIQERRLLAGLQEMAGSLLSESPQQVLVRLVTLACELLDAPAAAIYLGPPENLRMAAGQGHLDIAVDDLLAALRAGEPLRPIHAPRSLILPLRAGPAEEPLGAFVLLSAAREEGVPAGSEWDARVLNTLAHYAALAIEAAAGQQALEAERAGRALAEAFAALGDVAANLLHQVNNKVGAIPPRIEGIEAKRADLLATDPYLSTGLAVIAGSAREAMSLVRENMALLRPAALAPVGLLPCIESALADLHPAPQYQVTVEGMAGLPPVYAAPQSLRLVFSNLIENAIQAMPQGGQIRISGRQEGARLLIQVWDSGPGIPPELRERIFDLDYSGGAAASAGKLGFGLWWVRTLMARLGGSVRVEQIEGAGSAFLLALPSAEDDEG